MKKIVGLTVGLFMVGLVSNVSATIFSLDFEGLKNQENILDFYNGGTGSMGSSGTNYGVNFGSGALALIDSDAGGGGNFANEPSPDTIAFFLGGTGLEMNIASGFDTGFSFFYTSSTAASVTVWDGLYGTGNVLATLNLNANYTSGTGDPNGTFSGWDTVGVLFTGTAYSVDFSGTANQTGYDNITFGTDNPGEVPEPATMLLFGTGLLGLAGINIRRKKK